MQCKNQTGNREKVKARGTKAPVIEKRAPSFYGLLADDDYPSGLPVD